MTREIVTFFTKSTVPVGTHKSVDHAYLHPCYITSTMTPLTMSTLTIWRLGGNLSCVRISWQRRTLRWLWANCISRGDDGRHKRSHGVIFSERAHRRQLINAGVLRTDSLLLPERPLPQGPEFGDVFFDDLVLFSILHFSRLNELAHCSRAARARDMYGQLAMPTDYIQRDC